MGSGLRRLVLTAAAMSLLSGAALAQERPAANMSFFITSAGPGDGGNLGGLKGADAHCSELAKAAGVGNKTWRAYLSATAGGPGGGAVHARDRIGSGPWYNFKGVQVAANVADLHSDNNKLSRENSLTEKGGMVNGVKDTPNMHDIITGSTADGRLAPAVPTPPARSQPAGSPDRMPVNMTCNDWTTSTTDWNSFTKVGHHDRQGGGHVMELVPRDARVLAGAVHPERRRGAVLLLRDRLTFASPRAFAAPAVARCRRSRAGRGPARHVAAEAVF